MIEKTKRIYESVDELKGAIKMKTLKEGDELLTKDLDGECKYICVKVGKKKIHLMRKYILKDYKPMHTENFDAKEFLKRDYTESLREDLRKIISEPAKLFTAAEVFDKETVKEAYDLESDKKQFNYFKTCKHRIATKAADDEYSRWWWLDTEVCASAFALVADACFATYLTPSAPDVGLRPHLIIEI